MSTPDELLEEMEAELAAADYGLDAFAGSDAAAGEWAGGPQIDRRHFMFVSLVTAAAGTLGSARVLRAQGASDPDLARWCQRALEEATGLPAELVVLRRAQPATDTYELWFDKSLCATGGRARPGCGT